MPAEPLNEPLSSAPVPVKVYAAAVPLIEPELEEPVNLSSAPVPLNDADAPVITVVSDPFVGTLPADHAIDRFSEETVIVSDGADPTSVILFTVVVLGVTDTLPAGV